MTRKLIITNNNRLLFKIIYQRRTPLTFEDVLPFLFYVIIHLIYFGCWTSEDGTLGSWKYIFISLGFGFLFDKIETVKNLGSGELIEKIIWKCIAGENNSWIQ